MKNKPSSIWLFTDTHKTLNPTKLAEGLPQRSGIVIRHYNSTNKEAIIRGILNIKKRKELTVLISGKYRRGLNIDGK